MNPDMKRTISWSDTRTTRDRSLYPGLNAANPFASPSAPPSPRGGGARGEGAPQVKPQYEPDYHKRAAMTDDDWMDEASIGAIVAGQAQSDTPAEPPESAPAAPATPATSAASTASAAGATDGGSGASDVAFTESGPAARPPDQAPDRKRVHIFDTTLRDGEQSPGASMTTDEKLEVAAQLEALGVDVIEAGFPAASPGDLAAVHEIARRARNVTIAGLARANQADIDACIRALEPAAHPRLHVFIATSELHMRYKLNMTPEEVLARVEEMVAYGRRYFDEIEFSAEDATRSDWNFLTQVYGAAIQAGASVVNVPDTVGYSTPGEFTALFAHLRATVPGADRVEFSAHCHNDLGMATANTLAAIMAGAQQVEVTINGLGERAGNTALEEVVMALRTRPDAFDGHTTGVVTERLTPMSQLINRITGIPVQPNKAIVGANAFAHEAGIHQDGAVLVAELDRRGRDRVVPARHLDLFEFVGLRDGRDLVGDDGVQVLVVDDLLAVGDAQEALVDALKLLLAAEAVAQLGQPVPDPGAAGAGGKDDLGLGDADELGVNDLVGRALLQDAVLVDAGRVCEGVGADDGLVGLDEDTGHSGDHA